MSDPIKQRTIEPEEEAQLLDTIDRWVTRDVSPIVKEYDHEDKWPAETVAQMKELGLFGATVSTDYGGLGLPATTYGKIVMRISRDWMAITGHLQLAPDAGAGDRTFRHRDAKAGRGCRSSRAVRSAAAWR